jgi:sulfide:quinone oxidoreductase
MLHDLLDTRGVRSATSITVVSPMPMPIPISPEASDGIVAALAERDIGWWPKSRITSLDTAHQLGRLEDGRTIPYDLFLGIPVHVCPEVVVRSGLAVDGWVPVDHSTFATSFPDVYAVGDITSAPVPRVGAIAEGEAGTVADVLVHRFRGGAAPPPYGGVATCYVEFGGDRVAKFDADFLGGPTPTGRFTEPSFELRADKTHFGASRHQRWFVE